MKLELLALVLVLAACGNEQRKTDPNAPRDDEEMAPVPAMKDDPSDPPATKPPPPALSKTDVVGDYTTDGGDFEEVSLADDGSFSSFLHARPFYSGTWTLDGTTLTLTTGDGTKIVVTEVARTDAGLTGKLDTGGATAWKRVKD